MVGKLLAAVCCDMGLGRKHNQDNFFMDGKYKKLSELDENILLSSAPLNEGIFAICDGMGGTSQGGTAAYIAVKSLKLLSAEISATPLVDAELRNWIAVSNSIICAEIEKQNCSMGTTAVAAAIKGSTATIISIGDSRAYLFRSGTLTQLSEDDTELQYIKDNGAAFEMGAPINENKLTQHIGIDPEEFSIVPHLRQLELHPRDFLLLCSDGLSHALADASICRILKDFSSPLEGAEQLVREALEAGGKDNITAMLIEYFTH